MAISLSFDDIQARDGVRLRVARTPAAARSLMLFPGRTEFIEKYQEVLDDLHRLGFACTIIDWRGQGGSDRLLPDPKKGHIDDFRAYQKDVDAYLTFAEAHLPEPRYALAHSMGSTILLERLQASPATVRGAVLSAPFLDLAARAAPRALVRAVTTAMALVSRGRLYAPGHGPDVAGGKTFETNILTSDRQRFETYRALCRRRPDLMIGGVTVGWVRAAFRAFDRLFVPGGLERITTPLWIAQAGADRIVGNAAQEEAVRRMPRAHLERFPGAEHELLLERDGSRNRLLQLIDEELRPPL